MMVTYTSARYSESRCSMLLIVVKIQTTHLQEDLNNNISQEAAAEKEKSFFDTDPCFSSKRVAAVRNRWGLTCC